jgi:hypothetical protein
MRKIILTGMALAMLAVPTAAMASANGIDQSGAGGVGTSQGNAKNTTQQYKATYTDPVMGGVTCAGVHKTGTNYNGGSMDSWTCTSTTGSPLVGVSPGQVLDIGWNSDYAPLAQKAFPTVTAHLVVSADGMSETGTASYPVA